MKQMPSGVSRWYSNYNSKNILVNYTTAYFSLSSPGLLQYQMNKYLEHFLYCYQILSQTVKKTEHCQAFPLSFWGLIVGSDLFLYLKYQISSSFVMFTSKREIFLRLSLMSKIKINVPHKKIMLSLDYSTVKKEKREMKKRKRKQVVQNLI